MTYSTIVPLGGHAGWAFLQRTREQQQAALAAAPQQKRLADTFRDSIAQVKTAEQLVENRALREVALGAFGLQEDLENRAFILKVLKSNSYDQTSFANRLSDKRYQNLTRTFGFGDITGPRTADQGFADQIIEAYQDQRFEISVGKSDENLRLALGLGRELSRVNEREALTEKARWYTVMATPPLRRVFETALNLPQSFGSIDIEQQLMQFQSLTERKFGTSRVSDFSKPELQAELISRFLSGAEAKALMARNKAAGQIALSLLSSSQSTQR